MPRVELDAGEYLLDMMMDMGPASPNGFGMSPRSDAGITAYATGIGVTLEPWEFRALRKMCRAFLVGMESGKDRFSIPPADRK